MKVNPTLIDWKSDENYFFHHPQKEIPFELKALEKLSLTGHLFVMTSGTKNKKCVALSKKAFLNSAQAVNQHLKITKKDRWLICLPLFHVGGLSILARSFLSESPYFIFKKKWSPRSFLSYLEKFSITVTSLVPTQVYDLVFHQIKAPSDLRAVVVGGSALHESLYRKARKLKWPLLPSYGLTELCSQMATAELCSLEQNQYPALRILNHCKVQTKDERIAVQSNSLLTGWFSIDFNGQQSNNTQAEENDFLKKWENPVKEGWLMTEDKGEILGDYLKVYGRDQYVKIRGEGVSLNELNNILLDVQMKLKVFGEYCLLAVPHPRIGHQIDLVSTEENVDLVLQVRDQFNQRVLSNEQVQNCYFVRQLPKSSLSKIQMDQLKKQLGF